MNETLETETAPRRLHTQRRSVLRLFSFGRIPDYLSARREAWHRVLPGTREEGGRP